MARKSNNKLELALLVQCGFNANAGVAGGNFAAAGVFNKSLGTIEVGKLADLILLDANPFDDIHNTQRLRAVIVGGKLMNRSALDKLLALGETMANKTSSEGDS